MLAAEIQGSTIVNVVVCDQAFATAQGLTQIDQMTPEPGIGWTTSDGGQTWQPPAVPAPTPAQQAQGTLQTMFTQVPAMQQQISTDAAMFAATPVGSTLTAEHIAALGRIVDGFTTVLEALQAHAIFTGAIDPPGGS